MTDKIKLGIDLDYNEKILKLSREKLGWNFDLRIDANASWSLEIALESLKLCRKYWMFLVKEPFGRGRGERLFLLKDTERRAASILPKQCMLLAPMIAIFFQKI